MRNRDIWKYEGGQLNVSSDEVGKSKQQTNKLLTCSLSNPSQRAAISPCVPANTGHSLAFVHHGLAVLQNPLHRLFTYKGELGDGAYGSWDAAQHLGKRASWIRKRQLERDAGWRCIFRCDWWSWQGRCWVWSFGCYQASNCSSLPERQRAEGWGVGRPE